MPDLIKENQSYSKDRLLTAISLIMLIEHQELSLAEVIHATGMDFSDIRSALQNLVNLRLVQVIPTQNGIPRFQLLDLEEAQNYLEVLGVSTPH